MCSSNLSDVDRILEQFDAFQKNSLDLSKSNVSLRTQLQLSQRNLEDCQQREKTLQQEVERMKNLLLLANSALDKKCDKQDENRKLKEEYNELQQELMKRDQVYRDRVADVQRDMDVLKQEHESELSHLHTTLTNQCEEAVHEVEVRLGGVEQELREAGLKFDRLLSETKVERSKLTSQYEMKLSSLQRQLSTAASQNNHMSTVNQDIFRKKLQHIQAESDRKIGALNETIVQLRQQLEQSSSCTAASAERGGRMTARGGRKFQRL